MDEILLNPGSLKQFLKDKFSQWVAPAYGFGGSGEKEVEELSYFNINNIAQLNDIIPAALQNIMSDIENDNVEKLNLTYLVLAILIIQFGEKYFDIAKKTRNYDQKIFEITLKTFQDAISKHPS